MSEFKNSISTGYNKLHALKWHPPYQVALPTYKRLIPALHTYGRRGHFYFAADIDGPIAMMISAKGIKGTDKSTGCIASFGKQLSVAASRAVRIRGPCCQNGAGSDGVPIVTGSLAGCMILWAIRKTFIHFCIAAV